MKKIFIIFIGLVLVIVAIIVLTSFAVKQKNFDKKDNFGEKIQNKIETIKVIPSESQNIVVVEKENILDKSKTDIYLKNPKDNSEEFFVTISEAYRQHYHNTEYHNGNIYVIKRTGGDEGYLTNPHWTDELWKYDKQKKGVKLYSVQGLDFRVTDDEKIIAIITNNDIIILDGSAKEIKAIKGVDILLDLPQGPRFDFLAFGENCIWLNNKFGPSLVGLVKIGNNFEITKFNLIDLGVGVEFGINGYDKLVFSDYPPIFDVVDAENFKKNQTKVNLFLYDIDTKNLEKIATIIAKKFEPKWVNNNTIEYNNPNGEGRVTKKMIK